MPGGWLPASGNWAVAERIVNLSYSLPYAYPDFARVDPERRRDLALDTGHALLERVLQQPGVVLPPDFMTAAGEGLLVQAERLRCAAPDGTTASRVEDLP